MNRETLATCRPAGVTGDDDLSTGDDTVFTNGSGVQAAATVVSPLFPLQASGLAAGTTFSALELLAAALVTYSAGVVVQVAQLEVVRGVAVLDVIEWTVDGSLRWATPDGSSPAVWLWREDWPSTPWTGAGLDALELRFHVEALVPAGGTVTLRVLELEVRADRCWTDEVACVVGPVALEGSAGAEALAATAGRVTAEGEAGAMVLAGVVG